jgi:hypothetical protein
MPITGPIVAQVEISAICPLEIMGQNAMALTRRQKNLLREAEQIAGLTKTDFDMRTPSFVLLN